MATIKSYTDIEQSMKLAEILPIESADMQWLIDDLGEPFPFHVNRVNENEEPCWSLAALLELIPNYVISKTDDKIYANLYYGIKSSHDNLVDAAFELICQLKEDNKI